MKGQRNNRLSVGVQRVERRPRLLSAVSQGALLLALGTCLLWGNLAAPWQHCLEVTLYVSMSLLVLRDTRVAALWRTLPSPYHLFLGTLMSLLLSAQLVGRSGQTFPFVEWAMYSRQPPAQPLYFSTTAVLQSGQTIPLTIPPQYRSISRQLRYYLNRTSRQIAQATHAPTRHALLAQYEATLRALAGQYKHRYTADPVRTIQVWRCSLPPLPDYSSRESIDCQLFWQVPPPPEESYRAP